jgi:hypothetical protein
VDAPDSTIEEAPTNRRGFLRKLGALAAVGLGAAMIPAKALAQPAFCCYKPSCGSCPGGYYAWYCSGGCSGQCCICLTRNPNLGCFYVNCPCA